MAIGELSDSELDEVSGAGWDDVGTIAGGIVAVGAGVLYTVETGGIGGFLGGGLAVGGGLSAISSGFQGLHDDWYCQGF